MNRQPPRWSEHLLRRALGSGVVADSIVGDLREEHTRRQARGGAAADWWYRREAGGIAMRALANRVAGRRASTLEAGRWHGHGGPQRRTPGGDGMISTFLTDVRIAARSLAKAPRFTLVAVFTLALGIGANTAIFSVVNGVLLRPLPYPDDDQLVNVWSNAPGLGYDEFPVSPDIFFTYQRESAAFEAMALFQARSGNVTDEGEPERVQGAIATHTLFSTLGVQPAIGRVYTAGEDLPEGPEVVVLSHALWERRFGGAPDVLGRTLRLDGRAREVIGVMPERFAFPDGADFWIPAGMDPESAIQGSFGFRVVARLAPGVTVEAARAGLVPILQRLKETLAGSDGDSNYGAFLETGQYAPLVHPMRDDLVGNLERPLWILLGTVGFVLLIACANVANLVLIRSEVRRRETAVRVAVGATGSTLARYLLTESALLAGAGAALGLLMAWVGVPLVLRQAPPELPRLDEVSVDRAVLGFAALLGLLSTVLFALPPLLRLGRPSVLGALRRGGRGTTGGERGTGRRLLVVGQTSLALVLLVGSGLLVRSFGEILRADMGFESSDRITFGVFLPPARYPGAADVDAFHERLRDRILALPGARAVGAATFLPLSGAVPGTAHEIESSPTEPGQLPPMIHYAFVGPGYMETMGMRVKEGRMLSASDRLDESGVVLVSSAVADAYWPDGALGERIRGSGDPDNWYAVVGVVDRVVQESVREEPRPIVYYPMTGSGEGVDDLRAASYVVEATEAASLAPALRAAVWDLDPGMPIADMRTMDEIVSRSVVELSFTMFTLGIAALLALVLGAVGLYGVLSYSVAQRTQEIGVRMALGAETAQVLGMIVREGARTQVVGLLIGIVGAAALTRVLQGLLFGVEALDALTFVAMSGMLFGVGLLAAWLPARRAARLDPVTSMRME